MASAWCLLSADGSLQIIQRNTFRPLPPHLRSTDAELQRWCCCCRSFSNEAGTALVAAANDVITVRMSMVIDSRKVVAANICAQTSEGLPDRTIVIGSHMDGVAAGPGNNDNGSGAATNLEMALSLWRVMVRKDISIVNRVRFCWWGAEEEGLVGSRVYVDSLSDSEISQIAVNLNYDMVGSPNYVIGVYNGSSLMPGGGSEELRTGGMGQAYGSAAL